MNAPLKVSFRSGADVMAIDDLPEGQRKFHERISRKHRFRVDGIEYVTTSIPPLNLIGIARRIAPFVRSFTSMSVAFEGIAATDRAAADGGEARPISRAEALDRIVGGISPVLVALSEMTEADQNYIISACLGATVRVEPGLPRATPLLQEDKPLGSLSAGEILGITAEALNWELPALWAELQQLGGLFQGIVGSAGGIGGGA